MVQREVSEDHFMSNTDSSVIHQALKNFDDLPASAFVSLAVVCALFACSPATVWRRVRQGQLVAPHRIGSRTTRWLVGELRQSLSETGGRTL